MVKRLRVALVWLLGTAASGEVNAAIVGPAADYNVFVFGQGSFTSQNTDSQGNIAAGGNVNLQNYAVAGTIAGNPSLSPNPARLVVGGNLTANSGGVGAGQNGAIYVGGTHSLTSFTATGGIFGQTLVDFSAAQAQYRDLSNRWGSLAANATATLQYGTLTLRGTNASLNVFSLSAADLTGSSTVNVNAPVGSTVLVNVTGNNAVFQNGQVSFSGTSSAYLMYNFISATSVNLAGSKNPMGSILAPQAGVSGGYGAMNGQLITGSYSGNTQFNNVVFAGSIPVSVVPLPPATWLLVSGFCGFSLLARRHRGLVRSVTPTALAIL